MKIRPIFFIPALIMVFMLPGMRVFAQYDTPMETVVNYIEGMYTGDSLRVETTLAKDFTKSGFAFDREKETFQKEDISRERLFALANYLGKMDDSSAEKTKNIQVFDSREKIASVKLDTLWGIEFLHLVKEENGWIIKQIIWQGYTD